MSETNSNVPQTGSAQWKKNEKIINENPTLKRARDQAQGYNVNSKSYGASHGGKGSARRGGNEQAYADNWERIFGHNRDNVNHTVIDAVDQKDKQRQVTDLNADGQDTEANGASD